MTQQRYPVYAIISSPARSSMASVARDRYGAQRTEWGGLLWGHVLEHPGVGPVVVVTVATSGICQATPTTCEILPATWEADRVALAAAGLDDLVNVGDWHSHPRMGVFLSGTDQASFWSHSHVPFWISVVVDPFRGEADLWAKDSPRSFCSVPGFVAPKRMTALLAFPRMSRIGVS